ncbi:MAG: peptidoglycan DD-metalloendopeptidase family protein [Rhizobiales bacterium]|nr:peptidoglycan DD-metalloendopeptidase family protein [Hyphomicrobiales bacterium]
MRLFSLLTPALLALVAAAPARAQESSPAAPGLPPALAAEQAKTQRELELRGVEDTLKSSEGQRRKIEGEIEAIRADRARLNAALIDTAARVRGGETRAAEIEKRLDTLAGSEEAIRRSLESRRGVIAEVLAALQRMGRRPPPAILADPADILQAIRSSLLLGAVLPELRAETEALASDLAELVKLRKSIAVERETLTKELASLGEERMRLAALVAARQGALADAERALGAERERARELARQATSLKDLIGRMESEIAASARAAEAARRADEARAKSDEERRKADAAQVGAKVAAALPRDPARLQPTIAFADARGQLPMPVAGRVLKTFGAADGFGGAEKGLSIATRAASSVSSPTDGWISFAGPWRSWGQLLIINAGGGYYVVLAGMERVNVDVGQFVLAGEPVGAMGSGGARTAAAAAIGATEPVLYVEFRKDGSSIDPGPWWAKQDSEKARG